MRRSLAAVLLLCAVTACSSGSSPPRAQSTPSPTVQAAPPSTSAAATATAAPADGGSLPVRLLTTRVRQGSAAITRTLPVFSGALAANINRRVRRSADDGIKGFGVSDQSDVAADVEVTGKVMVNNSRTIQVVLSFYYFAHGAAHPTDSVSTVVLRRSDGAPVLLTDVLAPLKPALTAALHHASTVAVKEGAEDPGHSLTPTLKDWADWDADAKGMMFFFDDYQAGSHAAGLRQVDIPWSVLRPWVRPDAYALLGP